MFTAMVFTLWVHVMEPVNARIDRRDSEWIEEQAKHFSKREECPFGVEAEVRFHEDEIDVDFSCMDDEHLAS